MSKRRSRSLRPEKARNSEPPAQKLQAAAAPTDHIEEHAPERVGPGPADELALLDAGWDELPS
jgi:hypothetical protein